MRFFAKILAVSVTAVLLFAATSMECVAANESGVGVESLSTDSTQNRQQGGVLNVYVVENEIHLSDIPDGATLYVYSITGARIGAYTVHENRVIMDKALAKGIYIIRVNNRAAKVTVR